MPQNYCPGSFPNKNPCHENKMSVELSNIKNTNHTFNNNLIDISQHLSNKDVIYIYIWESHWETNIHLVTLIKNNILHNLMFHVHSMQLIS